MTITANLHIGLAGWSNATYAVGNRRSNAGNAYQCITAGTSTSPPTGTGSNITPGGTSHWKYLSAIDFTTLQAWVNSFPGTLTQPMVGLLWNDGAITTTTGTAYMFLNAVTTSSTNTITIGCAPGESVRDYYAANPVSALAFNTAHGVSFVMPTGSSSAGYLFSNVANLIIDGIQFQDPNTDLTSSSRALFSDAGGSNLVVRNCIIDGYSRVGSGLVWFGDQTICTNTLFVDRAVNSGSATIEIDITGSFIVNCTIAAINGSNSAAVDGKSAGGQVVRNCVMVGYTDTIFCSTAGGITVDHCVLSTSAIGLGTGFTNGGSNTLNAVATSQFANYSTDFHLKTGSACINAGATDATHIPSATDIQLTSRPQGTNWDIGVHELLVGTVILRDFVVPTTWNGAATPSNTVLTAEWQASRRMDVIAPIEWRGPFFADSVCVAEFRSSFIRDATVPVEWRLSLLNLTKDTTLPLEWGSTQQSDMTMPIEASASPRMDAIVLAEWTRQHAVSFVIPTAIGQSVTRDAALNAAWTGQLATDATISAEWLAFTAISADQVMPIEWSGIITVVADAPTPIEWRSTFSADSTAAIESTRTHTVSIISPVSWGNTARSDATFPAAWGYGILADQVMLTDWRIATVTGDSRMVLEWGLTAQADSTAPLEWGKTVAGDLLTPMSYTLTLARDATQPVEFSTTRLGDVLLPLDLGGGQGSVANVSVPVEWRSGVFADMPAVLGYSASVTADALSPLSFLAGRSADYVAGAAWLASPFGDAAITTEWGHLTKSATRDDRFALEFLQSVVTDIVVTYTLDVGRKSIGASLAPDEWECEHEP